MPVHDSQLFMCVLLTSEIGSKQPSFRVGPLIAMQLRPFMPFFASPAAGAPFDARGRKGKQGCSTLAATSALTLAAPKKFQLSLTACDCRPGHAFPQRWRRSCFL